MDFSAGLCRKLRMMRLYSLGFSIWGACPQFFTTTISALCVPKCFWSSYARLMLKISSYSPQTTKKFSCKNSKAARITTKTESESARNRNHLFLQLFKKRHQSYQFEVWSIHWLLSIWSIHLLSHHIKNKWMQCHFLGKTCSWKYPGLQMHNAPQLVESTTK